MKNRDIADQNSKIRELAIALLQADTETEVIELLTRAGYWTDPRAWRLYGDRDGNFATIGNQQSRPEAALVEKLVNAVDARLLNECLIRGIDPISRAAPPSIRHAVSLFFEDRPLVGEVGGTVQSWSQPRQLEQSHFITLAVTGPTARNGSPSLTITDCGEGQTPAEVPLTFLSIDRANKLRIQFVQGKFNMGGTGALKFCGQQSLQLIITRRNPSILAKFPSADPRADQWSFTVIRRERPTSAPGKVRNSVYRYLAPIGAHAHPEQGELLTFFANQLQLMPNQNRAYERLTGHGSVVKLYEYDMKGFKSHALMKGGLLSRLEILLPEIALPIRIHECRAYRGDEARSFANTLVGLTSRLDDNPAANLERGYPTSVPLAVRGERMTARIYAFLDDKAESYRTNEGIIFTVNGQTHGAIPKTFFERSSVKMGRLARSLIVVVDCNELSVGAREDLFMNSRDRLSNGELRKAIEEELEELIAKHPGLKELRERRRQAEIANRLEDSRPLEDVLSSVLKTSPSLSKLFLMGQRLSRPYRSGTSGGGDQGGSGTGGGPFVGRPHPTFFRFAKRRDGEVLLRTCELGRRCRIKFETDVTNEYFSRSAVPGRYHVEVLEGSIEGTDLDHSLTLHDGIANWSINLPEDQLAEGEEVVLQCTVTDDVLPDPFVNVARIRLLRKQEGGGGGGTRETRGGKGAGAGAGGKGDQDDETGIKMPDIVRVHEGDPEWIRHGFDDLTACKVIEDATDDEDEQGVYTFYVNVDNRFLRTDMKESRDDPSTKEAKFVFGNVLLGLGLIHDRRNMNGSKGNNGSDPEVTIDQLIGRVTRATAPFLVPMIDSLGALSPEDAAAMAQIGDED